MASSFLFLFCFFIGTTANHQTAIQEACKATRWPESCQISLTKSDLDLIPADPSPFQILHSALSLSSKNLGRAKFMVRAILHYSGSNLNLTTTAKLCLQSLDNSAYRLHSAEEVLPCNRIKDARAWTSAALSYQFDCLSGLKKVNDTPMVDKTLSFMNNTLMMSTSNALSMMMSYEEFGNCSGWWRSPRTERDGFWESVGGRSGSDQKPGIPTGLKANVTVCKDGGRCRFGSVQMAVNAAPDNLGGGRRFVILIKEGVYEETVRVPLAKRNVVLIGEGMGKTVITGSLNVGQLGMTTYETATVGVVGDGFMARDLTIQNTAGSDAHQAVAYRSDSDLSFVENCELIGNQDTVYAHSLRQFYKYCIIKGNVDFIFGNSASVFHKCTILVRPRQLNPGKGENNVVAAHGRTDPAQATGFVFHECVINGTEDYMKQYQKNPNVHQTFLGRPWKEFSRIVFVRCKLEALVSPPGWMPWDGEFALKTLYFGEYGNSGLGSNLSGRVIWSSQIPFDHVILYSVHNFIQGDDWMLC
ncbi:unnamed protein product [Lactuca virosa]|uniref:pectinesterase n=1 Tax=Lactuca virosa TaxID=75947 RepID=A0AAU9NAU7_9ASTR|nr:unnamed protein product [Lactuca virosa]